MTSKGPGDTLEGRTGFARVCSPRTPAFAASSAPLEIAKPRRRRSKHEGKPGFQFVVATGDLSQFQDEGSRREIRSQAMVSWSHENRRKKRKYGQASAGNEKDCEHPDASASDLLTNANNTPHASSAYQDLVLHTQRSLSDSPFNKGACSEAPILRSCRLVNYQDDTDHERDTFLTLLQQVARVFCLGNSADPFHAIPQFENPKLDSLTLIRNSVRSFTSEETLRKWFSAIVSDPHMILSSTCLVSTWLDMKAGCSGDSRRTAMVKEETFAMIKTRLADPKLRTENTTLMAILHMLAGEMWGCSPTALQVHLGGVEQFVDQRGGIEALGGRGGGLADVTVSCCLACNILHETEPNPRFFFWEPDPADLTAALLESPVFRPCPEYSTIRDSSRCSGVTYGLLCDMRNLTELFLEEQGLAELDDTQHLSRRDIGTKHLDYHVMVGRIRNRLNQLPSAHTPGLPISNDWVYESCRIAALIYSAALMGKVPFSATGASVSNLGLRDPARATPQAALVDILFETLRLSDTHNLWDDMAGVLYWISTVGAAAARVAETTILSDTKLQSLAEERAIWIQRCLTMYSNRTMIVLIFQQPTAIIASQKTLLKIQRRLARG